VPKKRASSDRRTETKPAKDRALERSRRISRSSPPLEQKLRARLKTAEETLAAIHSGEVDALVVSGRRGERVITLKGGEPAYRMLVEAMSEGAATLSREGSVLYSNRRFAEMIRRPAGKMIGTEVQALVEETERERFGRFLAAAQEGVAKAEFQLRSSDGSLVPVHLSVTRFRGFEGHALGMVVTDLSEQKRRHAEQTRLQLAAIVDSSQDAIIAKTLDAKIVSWNRGAEEIYGYTSDEVMGQPISILLPPGREDEIPAIMERICRGEKVEHYETKRRRKDGTVIDVSLAVSPIKTPDGETVGASAVARNITESKQAAETKQAEAMHRLLLERVLLAQEEERRRIARELHDEAGQLLTSLLVGLRTLEDSRNVADAKAKGYRLREITAQAIDEVGRLARGLHPTALDDHGLGVALSRYVTEYAKVNKIAVDLTLSELDCGALPSAVQIGLYRILQEALTNVARHSGARAVRIRFAHLAAALQVAVTDNGHGFDTEAAILSSNHLGIQSMRERAAMLGGTVSFLSKSTGTRMLVHIPLPDQRT
jgi:PAS domain S-box-containing protein